MGIKPRVKEVYLSENERELCWKDVETGVIRKINVKDIVEICDNKLGDGMKRHRKDLKL